RLLSDEQRIIRVRIAGRLGLTSGQNPGPNPHQAASRNDAWLHRPYHLGKPGSAEFRMVSPVSSLGSTTMLGKLQETRAGTVVVVASIGEERKATRFRGLAESRMKFFVELFQGLARVVGHVEFGRVSEAVQIGPKQEDAFRSDKVNSLVSAMRI